MIATRSLFRSHKTARRLRAAGFREVTSEQLIATLHYPTANAALSAVFAGGPVAMAYFRFDETTKAGAHAEYL